MQKSLNIAQMHREYDMRPEDELYEFAHEIQQLIESTNP